MGIPHIVFQRQISYSSRDHIDVGFEKEGHELGVPANSGFEEAVTMQSLPHYGGFFISDNPLSYSSMLIHKLLLSVMHRQSILH